MLLWSLNLRRSPAPVRPVDRFDYAQVSQAPAGAALPPGMARMAAHMAMLRRLRRRR